MHERELSEVSFYTRRLPDRVAEAEEEPNCGSVETAELSNSRENHGGKGREGKERREKEKNPICTSRSTVKDKIRVRGVFRAHAVFRIIL